VRVMGFYCVVFMRKKIVKDKGGRVKMMMKRKLETCIYGLCIVQKNNGIEDLLSSKDRFIFYFALLIILI